MMYGYGHGLGWMMLMPLLWTALIAVIVWAAVRLARQTGDRTRAHEITAFHFFSHGGPIQSRCRP